MIAIVTDSTVGYSTEEIASRGIVTVVKSDRSHVVL